MDAKLLKQLCSVRSASGDEAPMRDFLMRYIQRAKKAWKAKPEIYHGESWQDCVILKFGKPRTAIFAHIDTVGFTVRYANQLLPIGSPDAEEGTILVGSDSFGEIACRLSYDSDNHALYTFGRTIDRGTPLTYAIEFINHKNYIQSPYLDNRLGVYIALQVAATLTDGVIVFSCGEEHGGGTVPFLARYIYEQWQVKQALIADITWVSDGVFPGKGVAISLRDRNVPRKVFVDRVVDIARAHRIAFQLEVEGAGSSDGRELHQSPYPFDWCFVGAPQQHAHTPQEKVHKADIKAMLELYTCLMKKL